MKEIRFGLVGTGVIASQFAAACAITEGASVSAVVSRKMERARAFAGERGIPGAYQSVEALALDAAVDCVYVGTPHPLHYENCRAALENGKPVLCEKPMVMNRRQAESLFALAKEKGLFLMEAMWTRFLPNTQKVMAWLKSGEIGELKFMDLQFSERVDPEHAPDRLVKPELGGGALYDLGVYTVAMASWFAGSNPIEYTGFCEDWEPGSDAATAMVLRYPKGILATIRCGFQCGSPNRAVLTGTKGRVEIDQFYMAPVARLYHESTLAEESVGDPDVITAFHWQVEAVNRCLRDGVIESDVVPAQDTIATVDVLGTMMKRFYPEFYGGN